MQSTAIGYLPAQRQREEPPTNKPQQLLCSRKRKNLPYMKRKIYSQLVEWKQTEKGKSALLIEGARRIGKSYIVEEFAKNEYDSSLVSH